jgi:hypothetical protein
MWWMLSCCGGVHVTAVRFLDCGAGLSYASLVLGTDGACVLLRSGPLVLCLLRWFVQQRLAAAGTRAELWLMLCWKLTVYVAVDGLIFEQGGAVHSTCLLYWLR